jgi:Ca-activated chloride channel family protein
MKKVYPLALSACALLALAASRPPAGFPQGTAPPPAAGRLVRVTLTVSDRQRRYATGLGKEQFVVLEEGEPRELVSFEDSEQPTSVGVVFDLSRRDLPGLLPSAKAALSNFVRAGGQGRRYFVVGFDGEAHLAADWGGTPEEVAAGFDRLAALRPSGKAALYDALGAALLKAAEGPGPKRVIILISDGRSSGSKLRREELFEAVRRSDALIYAVSLGPREWSQVDASDQPTLSKLCSLSGGFVQSARSVAEFQEFFERLSVELAHQYSVGFVPGDAGPAGGWRRLSFKVKEMRLKDSPSAKEFRKYQFDARGREGYYHQP